MFVGALLACPVCARAAVVAAGLALTSSAAGESMTTFAPSEAKPCPKVTYSTGACRIVKNLAYRDLKGCVLDLCHPVGTNGFPTVVWFHGGGLTSGRRDWLAIDTNRIAVATVEYRLMPKVGPGDCIDDAAAAAAWVKRHIAEYGGDANLVFVSGHSAGGYLTFMLGLDGRWLGKYGLTPFDFAGYMPLSGQVTKHFAVRKHFKHQENAFQPIIDEWAPLYHLKAQTPPFCVALGDPKVEWKMRAEENWFMCESLKAMGNRNFEFHSFPGKNHGTCRGPALGVFQRFVDRISARLAEPMLLTLTFDDGTKDHLEVAAPMIEARGWRGTFNIVTDNVGKKNHLTWDEIRELKRRGHEIASHTVSHVSLTGLLKRGDTNEVHRQYRESRDAIRRELGEAPRFMCHPYVAFDETTDALCREDGMTPMSPRRHNFGHGTKAGTASGIGAAIVRWRAEGRRAQDVLMHGVCPGGGWHPFDSKEDFAAFLDEIREREKRGEVKVVPYSEFMSALAREPEFW